MEKLYPNRMGFIEHFLVSGVAENDFVDDHIDDNQLHSCVLLFLKGISMRLTVSRKSGK